MLNTDSRCLNNYIFTCIPLIMVLIQSMFIWTHMATIQCHCRLMKSSALPTPLSSSVPFFDILLGFTSAARSWLSWSPLVLQTRTYYVPQVRLANFPNRYSALCWRPVMHVQTWASYSTLYRFGRLPVQLTMRSWVNLNEKLSYSRDSVSRWSLCCWRSFEVTDFEY